MKKLLFISLLAAFGFSNASAQDMKFGLFDHLGVGISLGTDGIGFDVAAPITDWAAVRAGMSIMPKVKYNDDYDIKSDSPTVTDEVNIEGKLNISDFKLLFDLYPIKSSSFHLTAGAFIGSKEVVKMYNTEMFITDPADYGMVGIMLGDHRFTSDEKGNVDANIEVASFKPYLGIGFGRAVPKKGRVAVSCDLGVKFWGTPKFYSWERDTRYNKGEKGWLRYTDLKKQDIDDDDADKFLDVMSKITIYPVLNIRISGRIF